MSMCIYHGNCADGFGAAWVVRKALGDIDFHGAKYHEPPPDVTGKDVVMVDFSYKRPVLLEMAEKANMLAEVLRSNDRVEGRDADLSRRVPSHDGLCPGASSENGK